MKNLKNLLPLFAFVLGIGLVFTQSAFTPKSTEYGYDPMNTSGIAVDGWVDLTGLVLDNTGTVPQSYRCDFSSEFCKVYFASTPNEETELPIDGYDSGTFIYNP